MPVTIADVRGLTSLGLSVVAGAHLLDREIRVVHVSEAVDPTPWLQGGEFLLTTGMKIDEPADFGPYVTRLADAGLAGLGFGVGMGYESTPDELRATAEKAGLPVLQIPVATPYLAISEAVHELQTAERHATITRAFDSQQSLTTAALRGGTEAVLAELAGAIDGWAMLVTAALELSACHPAGTAARLPDLLPDLDRVRRRGMRSSGTISGPDGTVTIHALGAKDRLRGLLVLATPHRSHEFLQLVQGGAVALLSLELERSQAASRQTRALRRHTLFQALDGAMTPAALAHHLSTWDLDPTAVRVCVFLCDTDRAEDLLDEVNERLASSALPGAATVLDRGEHGHVVVVTGAAETGVASLSGLAAVRPLAVLGVGDPVAAADLATSYQDAVHAATIGHDERRAVTSFDDLDALRLLLRDQPAEILHGFVRKALGPLVDRDAGRHDRLLTTLRVFLAHNGRWNDAAAELGVHRHTLRTRIELIERLTGQSLESGYRRMELWLAVMTNDRLVAPTRD